MQWNRGHLHRSTVLSYGESCETAQEEYTKEQHYRFGTFKELGGRDLAVGNRNILEIPLCDIEEGSRHCGSWVVDGWIDRWRDCGIRCWAGAASNSSQGWANSRLHALLRSSQQYLRILALPLDTSAPHPMRPAGRATPPHYQVCRTILSVPSFEIKHSMIKTAH